MCVCVQIQYRESRKHCGFSLFKGHCLTFIQQYIAEHALDEKNSCLLVENQLFYIRCKRQIKSRVVAGKRRGKGITITLLLEGRFLVRPSLKEVREAAKRRQVKAIRLLSV